MITLFGATGYTGQLIAQALERRGLPYRIAGRSAAKLQALSQTLPSHPAQVVADVNTIRSLPDIFADTRLLINCVGPFTDLGEPVVGLAAAHGVHYLDITNELAYVYGLKQYAKLARQNGAAIVPACGFEVALSDCAIARLLTSGSNSIEDISITYYLGGSGMSIGTRLSGLRIFATAWLAYREGKYIGEAPGSQIKRGVINGRPFAAINFPSSEIATVPLHCSTRNLHTWLAISRRTVGVATAIIPTLGVLLRTPLGTLTAAILRRLSALPDPVTRPDSKWSIQIEITRGRQTQTQLVAGKDAYGLTGEIAAYAAEEMTRADYAKAGVLAPAQALDAGKFLDWLTTTQGVTLKTEGPASP